MKLNYSKKVLILSIALFLLVLIFDLVFTNLLLGKVTNINNEVKQLTVSTQEREFSQSLKDSILKTEKDRTKLEQYFVAAGDARTAEFINQIEVLAKSSGLTPEVRAVDYEPVATAATSSTVSLVHFKLNIVGKWDNVFNFLQTIENLTKITLVQGVTLNASSALWSGDIDFTILKLND